MTLSRTDEIRQVASEWEFDKRIHAPRAARLHPVAGCDEPPQIGQVCTV